MQLAHSLSDNNECYIMHIVTSFNFCTLIQVMHPVLLKRIGILESVLLSKEPLVVSAYKDFDEVRTHRYCFSAKPCAMNARHGRSMLGRCLISKLFYFTRCADGRDKTWHIFEFKGSGVTVSDSDAESNIPWCIQEFMMLLLTTGSGINAPSFTLR